MLGQTTFWGPKHFLDFEHNFVGPNFFWVKIVWTCWGQNFQIKDFVEFEIFENFWVRKIFLDQKILVAKIFGTQKFLAQKNFGPKRYTGQKHF